MTEPLGRPGRLPSGFSRMLLLLRHLPVLWSRTYSRSACFLQSGFSFSFFLVLRCDSSFSASRWQASLSVRGMLALRPELDAGVEAS